MPLLTQINKTTYKVELPCGEKVEIGDQDALDFKPHLKLNRFKGESSISEGLPFGGQLAGIDGDKVLWEGKWDKVDVFAEFYPQITPQFPMGAYELQLNISSKPKMNKLYLPFNMTNLKAHFQPPLTIKEIEEGCVRPDDIVNSFAFYHASKGGMVTPQDVAKGITTGIAFHNLRPRLVNARGDWYWGFMELIGGFKVITIPWELLEGGHYPIRHVTGDTFGYTTVGGTQSQLAMDRIHGWYPYTGAVGTGVSMSIYCDGYGDASFKLKMALYRESNDTLVANSGTSEFSGNQNSPDWLTLNSGGPTVAAIDYFLCSWSDVGLVNYYYDAGKWVAWVDTVYNGWPGSVTWDDKGTYVRNASIYCTYTPAPPVRIPRHGFVNFQDPGIV